MSVQKRIRIGNRKYFYFIVFLLIQSWSEARLSAAVNQPTQLFSHTIVELSLGGDASSAQAINSTGQVVGWSKTTANAVHAFLYGNGTITDLGTLTGGKYSQANAINDLGHVTGYGGINRYGPMFKEIMQGFLWENGAMRELGALYCPCSFNQRYGTSTAYAINAVGQIVGDSVTVRGVRHAFLMQSHSSLMQDIGDGPGSRSISRALDINNQGIVVGDYAPDTGGLPNSPRAFLWQDDTRFDLGVLPGHTASMAFAINEATQVVGWSGSKDGSNSSAFLWENQFMQALGTLPGVTNSQAMDINRYRQVVGWSGTSDRSISRAFLWLDGMMFDLNDLLTDDPDWVLTEAKSINDHGQIVGTGLYKGQIRAFLMTLLPNRR